jgi:type IX secretion system PorP/SprF family membrane protein
MILLVLVCAKFSKGQDPTFSQYYYYPSYLNIASSGGVPGLLLNGGVRSQWAKVPGTLESKNGSLSLQLIKFKGNSQGLSFSWSEMKEGEGLLNTGRYTLGYAFHSRFREEIPIHFHLGFGFSLLNRSIDWSNLVFSDQLDPVLGIVRASSIRPPTDLNYTSSTACFGFILGGKGKVIRAKEFDWNLGYSTNNLYSFRKSFYLYDTYSSRRHTFHGELLLPITQLGGTYSPGEMAYNPQFSYHFQGGLKVLDFTNFVTHDFLKIGIGYRTVRYPFDFRNNNQAVYYIGFNKVIDKKFYLQVLYSYDQSLDKLATAVGATNEISICLYFSNFGRRKIGDKECTEFIKAGRLELVTYPDNNFSEFRSKKQSAKWAERLKRRLNRKNKRGSFRK